MINRVEFLLEERSMEQFLRSIAPRIVQRCQFEYRVFQGKHDLLKKLPARLKAYASFLEQDQAIVVLIDQDSDNCVQLKQKISQEIVKAGLVVARGGKLKAREVAVRVVVRELESWLMGDQAAVHKAFSGVQSYQNRVQYRDPDSIIDPSKELANLLRRHYPSSLAKIECAKKIAEYLDVQANRSRSFCCFRDLLMSF